MTAARDFESREAGRAVRTALFVVAAFVAYSFVAVARIPFLSEDWTQMAEMRSVATFAGALDPALEPLRPFQHAFFWVLSHCGVDPTAGALAVCARAVGLAFHALSCLCVVHLGRRAGLGRVGCVVALALFVLFPNVKSLAWSAAIGSPARVALELAALVVFTHHLRTPRAWTGALGLVLFGAALACHESAMLFPAILALWIVCENAGTIGDKLGDVRRAARDPWLFVLALSTVAYVVMLVLRTQRHHQIKALAALPANVVKAATALLPEFVRATIVDGFRGPAGSLGFVAAAGLFLALAALVVVCVWRSRLARFVVLVCALELALPVLGTGFVQRYAYLASALLAIGLGAWIERNPTPARALLLFVLGGAWLHDSIVDQVEYRTAGRTAARLVTDARRLRLEAGRDATIAIVDPPDVVGAELDVPLFNWGLDFMLAAHQVEGPFLLWRTTPSHTSTSVELVDRARIEGARREGSPKLIEFKPATGR